MNIEVTLFWITVSVYVLSTVVYLYGTVLGKKPIVNIGYYLMTAGFLAHSVHLLIRWIEQGHGPYVSRYEVFSSNIWVSIFFFILLTLKWPELRNLGVILMPISFLVMGWAATSGKGPAELPPSLKNYWLIIHVSFTKFSYGSLSIATALAVLYLLKKRALNKGEMSPFMQKIFSLEKLDDLSYRFVVAGFIFIAIMIISGAIWANKAWGRFWNWDPIEVWALISWLVYALYLHLRFTWNWRGTKSAWLAILAVFILLFAIFGVSIVSETIHSGYVQY